MKRRKDYQKEFNKTSRNIWQKARAAHAKKGYAMYTCKNCNRMPVDEDGFTCQACHKQINAWDARKHGWIGRLGQDAYYPILRFYSRIDPSELSAIRRAMNKDYGATWTEMQMRRA